MVPSSLPNDEPAKLARNDANDAANQEALAALGWACHVVWECEMRGRGALAARLRAFLDGSAAG